LGERVAEQSYANQLRRRFPGSREYQSLQRGEYD
jgi:Tfp pilus assembly protein PilF